MRRLAVVGLLIGCTAPESPIAATWIHGGRPHFGGTLAPAGDVDGDGVPDLLVGTSGYMDTPAVWVYSGASGELLHHFVASPSFELRAAFAGLPDVNGDGRDDIVLTARGPRRNEGPARARIVSGADGSTLREVEWESGGLFWPSVAALDDLDGDSTAEFAVGVAPPVFGERGTGSVLVFSGATGEILYRLEAPAEAERPDEWYPSRFGRTICRAGDLDGDGHEEIAVGAPRARNDFTPDPDRHLEPCVSYVALFDGATGEDLRAIAVEERDVGASLACVGDVDGDGASDLVAGTGGWRVFVLSPRAEPPLHVFDAFSLDTYGFGSSVAGPGDLDGDGHPDILVGQTEGALDDGKFYYWAVFSGQSGELIHKGTRETWVCVSALGDVNADGVPDIALGYEWLDEVEIVSGADWTVLRTLRPAD